MSVQVNRTTVRRKDTSQCVQCGGFSTSVLTDDTKDLAFANVEGNSFYCNKTVRFLTFQMKQSFLNRSFFQILVADNQIFDFDCMLFFQIKSPLHSCFRSYRFCGYQGHRVPARLGTTEAEAYDEVPVRRLRTDAWM